MIITRLFYTYKEVEYSFITDLLRNEDIRRIYFWFFELFYSGFKKNSLKLLWKIYNTYYRIKNRDFEIIMIEKYEKFIKTNDISYITDIIYNLYKMKSCSTVFEIYNKIKQKDKHKRKFNITAKSVNTLIDYIQNGKHENVVIKLTKLQNSQKELYKQLKIMYPNVCFSHKQDILSYIISSLYIIVEGNYYEDYEITYKSYYYRSTINDIEFIKNIQDNKTDVNMRKYRISQHIGCFLEERFQEDYYEKFFDRWEYYANKSPIWKKRFLVYKCEIDENSKTVLFKNNNIMENFYQRYYFDIEDADYNIYIKNVFLMRKNTVENWLCHVSE